MEDKWHQELTTQLIQQIWNGWRSKSLRMLKSMAVQSCQFARQIGKLVIVFNSTIGSIPVIFIHQHVTRQLPLLYSCGSCKSSIQLSLLNHGWLSRVRGLNPSNRTPWQLIPLLYHMHCAEENGRWMGHCLYCILPLGGWKCTFFYMSLAICIHILYIYVSMYTWPSWRGLWSA